MLSVGLLAVPVVLDTGSGQQGAHAGPAVAGPTLVPMADPKKSKDKHKDKSSSDASAQQRRTDCPKPKKTIAAVPWARKMIDPESAWPFSRGHGVTVAVIDSGVDASQPQLKGRVLRGADFLHSTSGSAAGNQDCVGHGTEVASIIAAQRSTSTGFEGVAPDVSILPVTVSEQEVIKKGDVEGATVTPDTLGTAIRWAADHDADVINMSLVLYQDYDSVRSAVRYALDHNVVVVAAAGNEGSENDKNPTPYPASYQGVIGVAAINSQGQRSSNSQHGSYVDLSAPGENVVTAARGGGHTKVSGTSFAAPFVSGTAALVHARYPNLGASDLATRMEATATAASGNRRHYGFGVVNPVRAVSEPVASSVSVRPLPGYHPRSADPRAVARAAQHHRNTTLAIVIALAALFIVAFLAFAAVAVPRARRRRWRAGIAGDPPPPGTPMDAEPVYLFGGGEEDSDR